MNLRFNYRVTESQIFIVHGKRFSGRLTIDSKFEIGSVLVDVADWTRVMNNLCSVSPGV